jgi:hypothetical protein
VPLPVAATVAYFEITEAAKQVRTHDDLAEMRRLVAIALSTVVLNAAQINDLLFRQRDAAGPYANLDQLCIRRGDLRTALKLLKEARIAFGNKK